MIERDAWESINCIISNWARSCKHIAKHTSILPSTKMCSNLLRKKKKSLQMGINPYDVSCKPAVEHAMTCAMPRILISRKLRGHSLSSTVNCKLGTASQVNWKPLRVSVNVCWCQCELFDSCLSFKLMVVSPDAVFAYHCGLLQGKPLTQAYNHAL